MSNQSAAMSDEVEGALLPGPCCACKQDVAFLRNIVLLPLRRPSGKDFGGEGPGGWGCFVCSLPSDGAVAFVCDVCHEGGAEILTYVAGRPDDCLRRPVSELTEPFDHDPARHAAYDDQHFQGPWYE